MIVLIGIIIGGFLGLLFRAGIIGVIFGVAISLKIGGISQWGSGAIFGAVIGLVVAPVIYPMTIIVDNAPILFIIGLGLGGIISGALAGGINCKIFKSEKSWFWWFDLNAIFVN